MRLGVAFLAQSLVEAVPADRRSDVLAWLAGEWTPGQPDTATVDTIAALGGDIE